MGTCFQWLFLLICICQQHCHYIKEPFTKSSYKGGQVCWPHFPLCAHMLFTPRHPHLPFLLLQTYQATLPYTPLFCCFLCLDWLSPVLPTWFTLHLPAGSAKNTTFSEADHHLEDYILSMDTLYIHSLTYFSLDDLPASTTLYIYLLLPVPPTQDRSSNLLLESCSIFSFGHYPHSLIGSAQNFHQTK